jgi:hypothetical protein
MAPILVWIGFGLATLALRRPLARSVSEWNVRWLERADDEEGAVFSITFISAVEIGFGLVFLAVWFFN